MFGIADIDTPVIIDKVMNALGGVNEAMHEHPAFGKALMVTSSLWLDVSTVVLLTVWIFVGKSLRLVITIFIFYGCRSLMQALFIMPYAPGFFWPYPDFPSLVVAYGRTNDYFYSGHVGFAVTLALEYRDLGYRKWSISSYICAIYVAFVVISC